MTVRKRLTKAQALEKIRFMLDNPPPGTKPFRIASGKNQVSIVRDILLEKQGGRCPICGIDLIQFVPAKDRVVDHCHITGRIRAVLCRNCNGIEGKIYNLANRAKRQGTVKTWVVSLLRYWQITADNPSLLIHFEHKTVAEKKAAAANKARVRRAKARRF